MYYHMCWLDPVLNSTCALLPLKLMENDKKIITFDHVSLKNRIFLQKIFHDKKQSPKPFWNLYSIKIINFFKNIDFFIIFQDLSGN